MSDQLRPLARFFEGVLASQSFDFVRDFLDEREWGSLVQEEKELLSQLFLLSADQKIAKIQHLIHQEPNSSVGMCDAKATHKEILESFQAACGLTPESARVWYRLGSYLALQESPEALQEAIFALQTSITLDDRFFDAHYALASCALRYGVIGEESYLRIAHEAFQKASSLLNIENGEKYPPEFFWHWGIALFLLARDSGEPIDYQQACERYTQAQAMGIDNPDFFNDYANCVVEFALLVNRDDMIEEKAIPLYQEAILRLGLHSNKHSPEVLRDVAVRNFNIGCCYQHLFEGSHSREHFIQADRAFSLACSHIPREKVQFWQKWGQLSLYAGRLFQQTELIENACTYFEEAEKQRLQLGKEGSPLPISVIAYALWAQALLILSESKGQPYMLSDAYEKARTAFTNEMELRNGQVHPEVYASMALCLYGFGRYFHDRSYFEKARDIIHKGLVEHAKSASLWYALALIKLALGEIGGSDISIKEALISFMLASRSVYARFPVFWSDWGVALLHLADWTQDRAFAEEAVHRLERALELSEEIQDDSLYNLASAYDLLGELADDEQLIERALFLFEELYAKEKKEPHLIYQYALALLHLAERSEQIEDFMRSRKLFEEYLANDPEDEVALTEYALCLTHIGVLLRGDMEEEDGHTMTSFEKSDLPREWFLAEECFLQSVASGFSPAIYHLACLYSLMGNYHEAIEKLYEGMERDVLPAPDDILDDEWIHRHLLHTPQFRDFFDMYLASYNTGDIEEPEQEGVEDKRGDMDEETLQ